MTRVRKLFRDKMEDYKARAEAVRQAEVFEGAFAISVVSGRGHVEKSDGGRGAGGQRAVWISSASRPLWS